MSSLFDRVFPRISKRGAAESAIEPRNPLQPAANEAKDPILEAIREEVKANRVIHTYGYETELEAFAVHLMKHKYDRPSHKDAILPAPEQTINLEEEIKLENPGNPNTMWAYGIGGATVGFALAAVLMRKHVEPLTTLVYSSLAGIGGYTGSKLDQKGLLPPISYLPPPPPPLPKRRSHAAY